MNEYPMWKVLGWIVVNSVVVSVVNLVFFPTQEDWNWAGVAGRTVFFTLTMLLVLGGSTYVWMRRSGFKRLPATRQSEEIDFDGDVASAIGASERAVSVLDPKSLTISPGERVQIKATTRVTWKSFGERIEIAVVQTAAQRSSVRISTRPVLITTVFDQGRGLNNVRKFAKALREHPSPA